MHDESGHAPPPSPYGAPPPPSYGYTSTPTNTVATVGLWSGIGSLVLLVVCCPIASILGLGVLPMSLGIPAGIAGVVCGFLGLGKAKETGVGRTAAIWGIVTGGAGVVAVVATIVLALTVGLALIGMGAAAQ